MPKNLKKQESSIKIEIEKMKNYLEIRPGRLYLA